MLIWIIQILLSILNLDKRKVPNSIYPLSSTNRKVSIKWKSNKLFRKIFDIVFALFPNINFLISFNYVLTNPQHGATTQLPFASCVGGRLPDGCWGPALRGKLLEKWGIPSWKYFPSNFPGFFSHWPSVPIPSRTRKGILYFRLPRIGVCVCVMWCLC